MQQSHRGNGLSLWFGRPSKLKHISHDTLESIDFALDYVGVLDRIETIAHSFLKVNQCTWKERLRLLEG